MNGEQSIPLTIRCYRAWTVHNGEQLGPKLTQLSLLVLQAIAEHRNAKTGQCNPGPARLAAYACCTPGAASKAVTALRSAGFLIDEANGSGQKTLNTSMIDELAEDSRFLGYVVPRQAELMYEAAGRKRSKRSSAANPVSTPTGVDTLDEVTNPSTPLGVDNECRNAPNDSEMSTPYGAMSTPSGVDVHAEERDVHAEERDVHAERRANPLRTPDQLLNEPLINSSTSQTTTRPGWQSPTGDETGSAVTDRCRRCDGEGKLISFQQDGSQRTDFCGCRAGRARLKQLETSVA